MEVEAVEGKPVRFPPGRVAVRLDAKHWRAYRTLYARYLTVLGGLPVLREHDFDGRPVKMTAKELEALNRAFAALASEVEAVAGAAFEAQERAKNRLFKRLQYLS